MEHSVLAFETHEQVYAKKTCAKYSARKTFDIIPKWVNFALKSHHHLLGVTSRSHWKIRKETPFRSMVTTSPVSQQQCFQYQITKGKETS